MDTLLGMNWKTSLFGYIAGISTYFAGLGPSLPTSGKGWLVALGSAAVVALGRIAADEKKQKV